jgi:hypothetical protein
MTQYLLIPVALFSLLAWQTSQTPTDEATKPDKDGFISLFDGRSLEGWEGNTEYWKVRDAMIVGDSPGIKHNEFLCTKQTFGDFELRVTFRIIGDDSKNSGIQFRSKRVPNDTEVSGYQADIGKGYWGCLYDESRRNRVLVRPPAETLEQAAKTDDWNIYVIRCEGPRVTLTLNGVKTVEYVESDDEIARCGVIGLQIHSGNKMEAQFKDIKIKVLPNRP